MYRLSIAFQDPHYTGIDPYEIKSYLETKIYLQLGREGCSSPSSMYSNEFIKHPLTGDPIQMNFYFREKEDYEAIDREAKSTVGIAVLDPKYPVLTYQKQMELNFA